MPWQRGEAQDTYRDCSLSDLASAYERSQSFNAVNGWLHTRRYTISVSVAAALARDLDRPLHVFEIGCGPGKLFGELNRRLNVQYTGLDVEAAFVEAARRKYGHLDNFRVERHPAQAFDFAGIDPPDLLVALETFEHMRRDDVARVVEALAGLGPRCFVCSVPVEVGPAIILKNLGSWLTGYHRHREYSWGETLSAACYRLDRLPPHSGGHKGFDWRWLAQLIEQHFPHAERHHLPFEWLPAPLSTSMYFIASQRARVELSSAATGPQHDRGSNALGPRRS